MLKAIILEGKSKIRSSKVQVPIFLILHFSSSPKSWSFLISLILPEPPKLLSGATKEETHQKIRNYETCNIVSDRKCQKASKKSGEHGEHAPGTPKAFPRNKQGKKLSKRCYDSVLRNMFYKNSSIFQYFHSCIVL